jgi:hypothetical protein
MATDRGPKPEQPVLRPPRRLTALELAELVRTPAPSPAGTRQRSSPDDWGRRAPRSSPPPATGRVSRRPLSPGKGTIHGRGVAAVACELRFLAGSIGVATADRLVRAIHWATWERLPIVARPHFRRSRMQEGTVAFLQMVETPVRPSSSTAPHHRAALPGLPALADHRRCLRLLGLARPRRGRRARSDDRLPGAARPRGAVRTQLPRRCAGRREPAAARHPRRCRGPAGPRSGHRERARRRDRTAGRPARGGPAAPGADP